MSGVHLSDIRVGDIAKLKFGRGFMRIDEIVGNEVREKRDSGSVSWCDYTLIEAVGTWEQKMTDIKYNGSFYAGDIPNGKFMALYIDGSGGSLFMKIDGQNGKDLYISADGDEVEYDWFADAGYSIWIHVPNEFQLWYEREKS